MGAAPIGRGGRVVHRGAHEGMAELDLRGEGDQSARLRPCHRLVPGQLAGRLRGAAQQHGIAEPFRGSQEQHHPHLGVQLPDSAREETGEAVADRQRLGERRRAVKLLDGQRVRELDEGQRVALGCGHDAGGDGRVDGRMRGPRQ